MRFDWYSATIKDDPVLVIETLKKLGHTVHENDGFARKYHYNQGWEINHNERGTVCKVMAGGQNGDFPHAIASSDDAQPFADLLRNEWPDTHLPTRIDVCEDFLEPKSYERLRRECRAVAKENRLQFPQLSDSVNKRAGRTQYIGSRTSEYFGRVYEKGFEVISKLRLDPNVTINLDSITQLETPDGKTVRPADWTRLELVARPKGEEARMKAAVASHEQLWTFTNWSNDLAKRVLELDLERFHVRARRQNDNDRAFRFMCQQYHKALQAYRYDLGSWECVGLQIETELKNLSLGLARK